MILAINILMIGLLFYVFYEDVKERQVTLLLLLILFLLGGFLNSQQQMIELFLLSSLINLMVVSTIILILFVYSRFKMKTSLFKVFGVGDLLFFVFMAISFPITTFLVLFSASLIFSFSISIVFKKQLKKLIPLAGLQAFFLGCIIGVNLLLNIVNLYTI